MSEIAGVMRRRPTLCSLALLLLLACVALPALARPVRHGRDAELNVVDSEQLDAIGDHAAPTTKDGTHFFMTIYPAAGG